MSLGPCTLCGSPNGRIHYVCGEPVSGLACNECHEKSVAAAIGQLREQLRSEAAVKRAVTTEGRDPGQIVRKADA